MKVQHDLLPIIREMYRLYFDHEKGLTDIEVAALLGIHRQQVYRYRQNMSGVYEVTRGRYTCAPTPEQIAMAHSIMSRALYEQRVNPHKPTP